MKKIAIFLLLAAFLFMPVKANQQYRFTFLAAANAVADNTTEVNGVGFTSAEHDISRMLAYGAVTIEFTPAVPAAVNVEFIFAVSTDRGTTWTTDGDYSIAIPSNSYPADGNVVRWTEPFDFSGISDVRLERMTVGNGAGNCTLMNAYVSF